MLKLKTVSLLGHRSELDALPKGKLLINTINAHSYNTAQKDMAFAEALLNGDALIPDGASIVLAFKLLRHRKIERIAGWDLFLHEMKKLNREGGVCFFLGSNEDTLRKIKVKAVRLYPNIRVETYSPPYKAEFSEEDNRQMIEAVNHVKPDLLWVGMTAPKQEKWVYAHLKELDVNGPIGTIGAVFDFFAENIQRAPLWWQEHGLEWLYRLMKEPKRMWRRYVIGNALFLQAFFQQSGLPVRAVQNGDVGKGHGAFPLRRSGKDNVRPGRRVFDGIIHQIDQDLHNQLGIHVRQQQIIVHLYSNRVLLTVPVGMAQGFFKHFTY